MKGIYLITIAVLLSSCALSESFKKTFIGESHWWARKDSLNTEQEYRKNKADCKEKSNTAPNRVSSQEIFNDCMFGKGWRPSTKTEAMTKYEK